MKSFAPGDVVRVTEGMSRGLVGTVVEQWQNFGRDARGIRTYKVRFAGLLHCRVIRVDFLEPNAAEATR